MRECPSDYPAKGVSGYDKKRKSSPGGYGQQEVLPRAQSSGPLQTDTGFMATIPSWLNLLLVLVALLLTMAGSVRWAEAAFVRKADRDRHRAQCWLSLRMSNSLMLLAAIYWVMICAQCPPFGSLFEFFGSAWVIAAGAVLSAKGY